MTKIMVAVPAYRKTVYTACAETLLKLQALFFRRKTPHAFHFGDHADPSVARNVLASAFYADRSYTHLLFIDADMGVEAPTVERMIEADKPVVGVNCPKRILRLDEALESARSMPPAQAVSKASEFNIIRGRFENDPIVGGLGRVEGVGAAVMLIQRACFDALIATGKIRVREVDGRLPLYGFFDGQPVGTNWLSDDLAFCWRWINMCQGDIWALVEEPIKHIGDFEYQALWKAISRKTIQPVFKPRAKV